MLFLSNARAFVDFSYSIAIYCRRLPHDDVSARQSEAVEASRQAGRQAKQTSNNAIHA